MKAAMTAISLISLLLPMLLAAVMLASCSTVETNAARGGFAEKQATGKVHADCASCHNMHAGDPGDLKNGLQPDELCTGCHTDRASKGEHKVGVRLEKTITRLPLVEGKTSCISCHAMHGNTGLPHLLRLSPPELCLTCHDK